MVKCRRETRNILVTALILAVFISLIPMSVKAEEISTRAYPYTILRTVSGDGVRLRSAPNNGTILELMYKGNIFWVDQINLNSQIASGWMHGQRDGTWTIGYVDAHYVGY